MIWPSARSYLRTPSLLPNARKPTCGLYVAPLGRVMSSACIASRALPSIVVRPSDVFIRTVSSMIEAFPETFWATLLACV